MYVFINLTEQNDANWQIEVQNSGSTVLTFVSVIFSWQEEGQKGAADLKSEGNTHFKDEKYDLAAACYTQALRLISQDEKDKEKLKERGVILKNRAACYLKLASICSQYL